MSLSRFFLMWLSFAGFWASCAARYTLEKNFLIELQPWGRCKMLFSPQGKRVAVVEIMNKDYYLQNEVTPSMREIALWNLETGQCEGALRGHEDKVTAFSFSADGEELVSGDRLGVVKRWCINDRQCRETCCVNEPVTEIALHTGNGARKFVVGTERGHLYIHLGGSIQEMHLHRRHTRTISALAFLPTGQAFISASYDYSLIKWDNVLSLPIEGSALEELRTQIFATDREVVTACDLTLDGQFIVLGRSDGNLAIYSGREMHKRVVFTDYGLEYRQAAHRGPVWAVAFSYDGERVISSSCGLNIKIWERASGNLCETIDCDARGSEDSICALRETQACELWVGSSCGGVNCYVDRARAAQCAQATQQYQAYDQLVRQFAGIGVRDDQEEVGGQLPASRNQEKVMPEKSYEEKLRSMLCEGAVNCRTNSYVHQLMQKWIFKPLDHGHYSMVSAVMGHPSGRIISASFDGMIKAWDKDGTCLWTAAGHRDCHGLGDISLGILSDGSIVSGSHDGTVKIWDCITGKCLRTIPTEGWSLNKAFIAVLPDDRIVYAVNNLIKILSSVTGACEHTISWKKVESVVVLSDGRIAVGSKDGKIGLWDSSTGKQLSEFDAHPGSEVTSLSVLSTGILVSASSADKEGRVKFWNSHTGQLFKSVAYGVHLCHLTVLDQDRFAFIACNKPSVIQVVKSSSGKIIKELKGHIGILSALAVSREGNLISGSLNKGIEVWDSKRGKCLQTISGYNDAFRVIAELPNGDIVTAGSDNHAGGVIRILHGATGVCLKELKEHASGVSALAIFPDGRIASGAGDGSVKVWSTTGACLKTYTRPRKRNNILCYKRCIEALLVLSNGCIVAGDLNGRLIMWDKVEDNPSWAMREHKHMISSLVELPGKLIASGSYDGTVRIWDSEDGKCLHVQEYYDTVVDALACNTPGKLLISLRNGFLIEWDYVTDKSNYQRWVGEKGYRCFKAAQAYKIAQIGHDFICVRDRHTNELIHSFKPLSSSQAAACELLSDGSILSSSAEYHSKLGKWMRFGNFIKQLPAEEVRLIFKFIHDPTLTYYQLEETDKVLYRRLPYINHLVKKIQEWLL